MEKRWKGEMRNKRNVSNVCLMLLALLEITTPSSADNTTSTNSTTSAPLSYLTRPADITVAVGEPAVFYCGVAKGSPPITFTYYGSKKNYSFTCPDGHVDHIVQALYGSCDMQKDKLMAVWTLKGTSFSDNGTRVICQQSKNPDAPAAVLHVYDDGTSYATLIGCTIGGFFGTLLVAGLAYILLQRSGTVQKCYRGKAREDDTTTIVTKE